MEIIWYIYGESAMRDCSHHRTFDADRRLASHQQLDSEIHIY